VLTTHETTLVKAAITRANAKKSPKTKNQKRKKTHARVVQCFIVITTHWIDHVACHGYTDAQRTSVVKRQKGKKAPNISLVVLVEAMARHHRTQ
jgi:hypothetical protein